MLRRGRCVAYAGQPFASCGVANDGACYFANRATTADSDYAITHARAQSDGGTGAAAAHHCANRAAIAHR